MSTYQMLLGGQPADASFYTQLATLAVEENADLPDAVSFTIPLAASAGDLTWVGDSRIAPFSNVAVVVTPDDGGTKQCIFDGYVLSHKVHLEPGVASSSVEVWGQDASVLMTLSEQVREWSGLTDGQIADQVFNQYHFAAGGGNTAQDSPAHTDDGHTLMQRASDLEFLRRLARRNGRWCRVTCTDTPGQRTGIFAPPDLSGAPVTTINLNDPLKRSVSSLDFRWEVDRPSSVTARQGSLTDADPDGVAADTSDSGFPALAPRGLPDFAGQPMSVMLTAAGDPPDLPATAQAVLRDAGWFVRAEGTADLAVLKTVLRVGNVVAIEGVGQLLSGSYLVWSVRHAIATYSHTMSFVLTRNAVGPPSTATAGLSLPSLP